MKFSVKILKYASKLDQAIWFFNNAEMYFSITTFEVREFDLLNQLLIEGY